MCVCLYDGGLPNSLFFYGKDRKLQDFLYLRVKLNSIALIEVHIS